jgi:hypothetical protein
MPPLLRNEAHNVFKGRDREHLKSNPMGPEDSGMRFIPVLTKNE